MCKKSIGVIFFNYYWQHLLLVCVLCLLSKPLDAQEDKSKVKFITLPPKYSYDTLFGDNVSGVDNKYILKEIELIEELNPANLIVDKVYNNRKVNNYVKIGPYSAKAYDKVSVQVGSDDVAVTDEFMELMKNDVGYQTNFFVSESLSRCIVVPPNSKKETVLASKISGFKRPEFDLFLSKLVDISIYDEEFNIMGGSYLSPINKYAKDYKKYYYEIKDTIVNDVADTTFVMAFRPLINQIFNGFVGVMKINSVNWAIEHIEAELIDDSEGIGFNLSVNHEFYKHENGSWLPRNFETDCRLKGVVMQYTISADSLSKMQNMPEPEHYTEDSLAVFYLYPEMLIDRYFYEYDFNSNLKKSDVGQIVYDVEDDAYEKSDEFWEENRYMPLSEADKNAYLLLDTIGEEIHADALIRFYNAIMEWKVPVGKYLSIPLNRVIKISSYQKIYLGMGLETSPQLCELLQVGGYWGWGFKDKAAKWGGYSNWMLHKNTNFKATVAYRHDLNESGMPEIMFYDANIFKVDTYRQYLPTLMDMLTTYFVDFSINPFKSFRFTTGFHVTNKVPTYNYKYLCEDENGGFVEQEVFDFTTFKFGVRFALNEKFEKSKYGLRSLGTKFPILSVNYERGIKGLLGGGYDYNKYELSLEYDAKISNFMKLELDVMSGYLDSEIPYTNLFNVPAGYHEFTYYAPGAFGAMRIGEFVSDIYMYVFLKYDFKNILNSKGFFRLSPSLVYNYGYGNMLNNNVEHHQEVDFKVMNEGYHEVGLLFNDLIATDETGMGLGVYYRLGAYSFDKIMENFAYKFTVTF